MSRLDEAIDHALCEAVSQFAANAIGSGVYAPQQVADQLMITATLIVSKIRGAKGAKAWLESILAA